MELSIEIPDQYLTILSPQEMSKLLKMNTAIEMYRKGELSAGAGCELGGVDRYEFLVECRKRGIAIRTYQDEQELEGEVMMLRELLK